MYEVIYDSMLLWYRRWYSREHQLYVTTSFAMSMFLFFNLLTLAALLEIFGISFFDAALLLTPVMPVGIFIGLLLFNFSFGKRRVAEVAKASFGTADIDQRRKHALHYMIGSFFAFIITMIWTLMRHS